MQTRPPITELIPRSDSGQSSCRASLSGVFEEVRPLASTLGTVALPQRVASQMQSEWSSVPTAFDLVLDLIECDRLVTGGAFPAEAVAAGDAFQMQYGQRALIDQSVMRARSSMSRSCDSVASGCPPFRWWSVPPQHEPQGKAILITL
jgi:hypothetical protein